MKCDFCLQEKLCEHVGYGLVVCEECVNSELIKVSGGTNGGYSYYAFKNHSEAMKLATKKTKKTVGPT